MKQVKKRFTTSLAVVMAVMVLAAIMAHGGAVKVRAISETMKPFVQRTFVIQCAVGVLTYALWFAGYYKRLARAINPGTEPSYKLVWALVTVFAVLVPCILFMLLRGVCTGAVFYGIGYAFFAGISTVVGAAYTEI